MSVTGFYLLYSVVALFAYAYFVQYSRLMLDNERAAVLLLALLISALAAVRPLSVPDTEAYAHAYNMLDTFRVSTVSLGSKYINIIESGFALWMYLFYCLHFSFRMFLFVNCFLSSVLLISGLWLLERYVNRSERITVSPIGLFSLYLLYNGCHDLDIAIRTGLSLGLGLFAIGLMLNRKNPLLVIALLLITPFVQTMGVIFWGIAVILLLPLSFNRRQITILFAVLVCFMGLNLSSYIFPAIIKLIKSAFDAAGLNLYGSYLDRSISQFTMGGAYVTKRMWGRLLGVGALLIYVCKEDSRTKKLATVVAIGLILQGVAYPLVGLSRVLEYFMIFIIPIYAGRNRFNEDITFDHLLTYGLFPVLYVVQILDCIG